MAESIRKVAQMAMDAFYQEFRPDNAFLRLEHFLYLCIAADSKLKQDEYAAQVNIRLRTRQMGAAISMSADNYITVEAELKKERVKLPFPIMTFAGDNDNLGVASVTPVGKCKNIMRLNIDEEWMACDTPSVPFWIPDCDGVRFLNLKNNCSVEKVKVRYIPQLNNKGNIQEARKWAVLNLVTVFIKSAKDGAIIDTSNDGNSNVAQQTEINKYILKALQNR